MKFIEVTDDPKVLQGRREMQEFILETLKAMLSYSRAPSLRAVFSELISIISRITVEGYTKDD